MADHVEPVTVLVSRKVKPGREADYEEWIRDVTKAALKYQGHLGMNVFRPEKQGDPYVLVYKFDSGEHLDAWTNSEERARFVQRAKEMATEEHVEHASGLESWFRLPGQKAMVPPPRWKMAVVTGVCVWLMGMAIGAPLRHVLAERVPPPLIALITTAIMVSLLTWVVLPNVTKLLRAWLFTSTSSRDTGAAASPSGPSQSPQ